MCGKSLPRCLPPATFAVLWRRIKFTHQSVLKEWEIQTSHSMWQAEQCHFVILKMTNEPSHEIMVLFVLRKLILQNRMRSHPVGLDVWYLVSPFVYLHTSCVRTAKALGRLRGCAGSSEPLLVAYVISTIISWAGSIGLLISELVERSWAKWWNRCKSLENWSLRKDVLITLPRSI